MLRTYRGLSKRCLLLLGEVWARATASSAAHMKSLRRRVPPQQILQRSGEAVQEGCRRAGAAREQPHMRRHHALDGLRRRCRGKSSPQSHAQPRRGLRAQRGMPSYSVLGMFEVISRTVDESE